MLGEFNNIVIEGISASVPTEIVDNMQFAEQLGERRCKKQIRLTGVKQRHVSKAGQTSADLAYAAAMNLLSNLKWDPYDIDVLVFATQNPVFRLPSTAFFLQKRLGIKNDCVCFDINLGCSASTVGIQVVSSLLQQSKENARGLLLVADPVLEPFGNDTELTDEMLFGSAGSAVAIRKTQQAEHKVYFDNKSDGNRYQAIVRVSGGAFNMAGEDVFSFGVNDVAQEICSFRKHIGISPLDVDYYVFHQAQALMLTTMDNVCDIPFERELRSLEEYGNTNGSSVLVTLCANYRKLREKPQANLMLCGFGVGLSWCAVNMVMRTDRIFPLVYSDEIYKEW